MLAADAKFAVAALLVVCVAGSTSAGDGSIQRRAALTRAGERQRKDSSSPPFARASLSAGAKARGESKKTARVCSLPLRKPARQLKVFLPRLAAPRWPPPGAHGLRLRGGGLADCFGCCFGREDPRTAEPGGDVDENGNPVKKRKIGRVERGPEIIKAPIGKVYKVITDFDHYTDWSGDGTASLRAYLLHVEQDLHALQHTTHNGADLGRLDEGSAHKSTI